MSYSFPFKRERCFNVDLCFLVCGWYINLRTLVIIFFSDWFKFLVDFLNSHKTWLWPNAIHPSLRSLFSIFLYPYPLFFSFNYASTYFFALTYLLILFFFLSPPLLFCFLFLPFSLSFSLITALLFYLFIFFLFPSIVEWRCGNVIKRSYFSLVEHESSKPNVINSNPIDYDSILVILR